MFNIDLDLLIMLEYKFSSFESKTRAKYIYEELQRIYKLKEDFDREYKFLETINSTYLNDVKKVQTRIDLIKNNCKHELKENNVCQICNTTVINLFSV